MQTLRPPFDDKNARLAMSNALDLKAINAANGNGKDDMVDKSWFQKGSPFYDPTQAPPHQGLAKAQEYVDKYVAAHNGQPLKFTMTTAAGILPLSNAILQNLQRLKNTQITLEVATNAEAVRRQQIGDYQTFTGGPPNSANPNPATQMFNAYHTPPAAFYFNSKVNQLTKELVAVPLADIARQKTILKQLLQIVFVNDIPFIPLDRPVKTTISKAKVRGLRTYAGGSVDWTYLWLKK
jgi:ABC-type transport system substrate-binding protein